MLIRDSFGQEFASEHELTAELFMSKYASQAGFDPDGFFFVTHRGQFCGTAFAWTREAAQEVGVLHYLAVHPEHRSKGLARYLSLLVLHRHRACGKKCVELRTEAFRVPAIRLYLSLGFERVIKSHIPRSVGNPFFMP